MPDRIGSAVRTLAVAAIRPFVRDISIAFLKNLMARYTPADLAWHVEHDTNLIQETLARGSALDRGDLAYVMQIAQRYANYQEEARALITSEWLVGWFKRNGYGPYVRILETPRGERWLARNVNYGLDYIFGKVR